MFGPSHLVSPDVTEPMDAAARGVASLDVTFNVMKRKDSTWAL